MSKYRNVVMMAAALTLVLTGAAVTHAADFSTTIDFAVNAKATLDGEAGAVKVATVEFATSFAKKGLLGAENPDLKAVITARLDCANPSGDKWKHGRRGPKRKDEHD